MVIQLISHGFDQRYIKPATMQTKLSLDRPVLFNCSIPAVRQRLPLLTALSRPSLHPEQAEPRSSTFRRPPTPRWTIPEPLADPSIQITHLDHLNHVHVTNNHRSTPESAIIRRLTLPAAGAVHAPMLLLHPSTCGAVLNGGGVGHPVHVVRYRRLGHCQ